MEEISVQKAMKTALVMFVTGETMTNSVRMAFGVRSVINDMIRDGYTDEEIQGVWDEAEWLHILGSAE